MNEFLQGLAEGWSEGGLANMLTRPGTSSSQQESQQ